MYALDPAKFNRVSSYKTTKEIWILLEATHKDTNQIKETKINMLVHNYKMLKMKSDKSIKDMFNKFWDIISALKGLGKTYLNGELMRKILRLLPRS